MFREHYRGKNIVDTFYTTNKDINPLFASMQAVADTGEGFGRKLITPIIYGTGTSVGAIFSTSQAKAQGSTTGASALYGRWESDPVSIHGFAVWSRDAMDAAAGKGAGEIFKVMQKEMDTKITAMRNKWAKYAVGDGTGALAQIVTVSSTGFTVTRDRINRFHRGMDLCVATSTTGALKNTGTSILCTGTDPNTGTVYLTSDPTTSTAWAIADYVFDRNDRAAAAINSAALYILPFGAKAWTPGASVTDSFTFNGVTRDGISELAGLTYDCSDQEPENAFLGALSMLFSQGGIKAKALFCSPRDYAAFCAGKDKSKIVQISLGKYDLGFDGMTVHSLAGNVPVIPDAFVPDGEFYAGPWDDDELGPRLVYVNDLVNIDNRDGLEFRASASAASYEMRLYSRGNIIFPAPGKFIRGYNLSTS